MERSPKVGVKSAGAHGRDTARSRPSASIVICAYTERRFEQLVAGLDTAAAQCRESDELVVVVDHNPQLSERLRAHAVDRAYLVTVIDSDRARGLSGARNAAIAVVRGDVVVFLDDDARPRPGWLNGMLAPFAEARVQGVGGWAVPAWPDGERPAQVPPELDWVVGCSYRGLPTCRQDVRNVIGCTMAFRHSAFGLIGGFDENVGRIGTRPLGCEETELCIRLAQADPSAEIVLEPDAVVDHTVSHDRTTWRYLLSRCYAEGLSKARISRVVGGSAALSTERSYVRRTLTAGMRRELRRGRPGLPAAAAIPAAVALAGAGYVRGRVLPRR